MICCNVTRYEIRIFTLAELQKLKFTDVEPSQTLLSLENGYEAILQRFML